jgi:zinc D-Ala-D-Ala carboxypeptidase
LKLTAHFDLNEFTASDTAVRKGIDNTPNLVVTGNLRMLAVQLEQVRTLLNDNSLRISSGYRCLALNRAIGSGDTSAHVLGFAADFTCAGFGTPKEVANKIAGSPIKFDQIIFEGTWVHFSADSRNRREVLTATFTNGKARYTKGLI